MKNTRLDFVVYMSIITLLQAKEPDLPICPTNIQYLPQNLPMHCRMPPNANFLNIPGQPQQPTMPPFLPPFYQSPPPNKVPGPIPVPIPPVRGPYPMPMPLPMPLPMPSHGPAHKLPVIVMPFYSPDPSFKKPQGPRRDKRKRKRRNERNKKKRRPYYYSDTDTDTGTSSDDTDTDTSSTGVDTSSSNDDGWWRGRRSGGVNNKKQKKKNHNGKKEDLLTPILQYVTNDGYVIFEKKITKGEAKDWLNDRNNDINNEHEVTAKEIIEQGSAEKLHTEERNNNKNKASLQMNPGTEEKVEIITQRNPLRKYHHRKTNTQMKDRSHET